jgi:hypothetical protein
MSPQDCPDWQSTRNEDEYVWLARDFAFYCNSNDVVTSDLGDRMTALEELVATRSPLAFLRLRRRLRESVKIYGWSGDTWAGWRQQAVSDQRAAKH